MHNAGASDFKRSRRGSGTKRWPVWLQLSAVLAIHVGRAMSDMDVVSFAYVLG